MSNKPDISVEAPPPLSFREKSLWVMLCSIVAVYAYYFWHVITRGEDGAGVLFVGTVIAMAVIQSVAAIAMAIHRRPEKSDERDKHIALIATRISYYVLQTGVWVALATCVLPVSKFWVAHVGLGAVVLAELTSCVVQLVHYRRGA